MFQTPSSDLQIKYNCSTRLTLYYFGIFIHSNTASTPLGSIEPHTLQLMRVHWSCSYQAHQASFSFLQQSELEQCRVQTYSNVLTTPVKFLTMIIFVKRPTLFLGGTAYNRHTYLNYHILLVLLRLVL